MIDHTRKGGCKDIELDNFSLTIGGRTLLDSTNVKILHGKKYGLIGRNGIGKTVFMNKIATRADK